MMATPAIQKKKAMKPVKLAADHNPNVTGMKPTPGSVDEEGVTYQATYRKKKMIMESNVTPAL